MIDGKYEVPEGTLHIYSIRDDALLPADEKDDDPVIRRWACMAYDHGPLCRRCQSMDEVLEAMLENVLDGRMIPRQRPDGQFEFKMTEAGNQAAGALIKRLAGE